MKGISVDKMGNIYLIDLDPLNRVKLLSLLKDEEICSRIGSYIEE